MSDQPLDELVRARRAKLERLKALGYEPYPHRFARTHGAAEVTAGFAALEGKPVAVAGRVMSFRSMGKAAFAHLQDASGRLQVYVRRDEVGETPFQAFEALDLGDFVGVEGTVMKTRTGEVSVQAKALTPLAKALRPLPVVKEKDGQVFDAFADKELRYRKRYLDLAVNPAVREVFVKRTRIISALRAFLDGQGFLEVETPVLQSLYGGAAARPFKTHLNALDLPLFLRIADELYLKRLVVGGFDRVYEIAKDFRNEGMDATHSPEFTMLEFYWAYADYTDAMDLVERLFRETARQAVGTTRFTWRGKEVDLTQPFARRAMADLAKEFAGIDLLGMADAELVRFLESKKVALPPKVHRGQLMDAVSREFIEPNLVQPTFLMDYPVELSPLAKRHRGGDARIVERFELFIGGSEFANSFSELNNPDDQRARLSDQGKKRAAGDEEAEALDEDFLEAMESGMPPMAGVGMGVDRLVMLLTNQPSIRDVILFPTMRPL